MAEISPTRYRPDDLRRLATDLTSSLGVEPARASALATHLLWFDAAGASSHGIASLPGWLDRLEKNEVDPVAPGRAILERAATGVFDAQQGLAPLALAKAAEIASEKAREVGVGMVRVRNLGPSGPSAPVVSGLAVGPFVAWIAGPGPSLAMALPTEEGLPAIYDSDLDAIEVPGRGIPAPPEGWLQALAPWISPLAGGDGWLIVVLSVPALEPLSAFHRRVSESLAGAGEGRGQLWPASHEARRREARERGVSIEPAAMASLKIWSGRLNVTWPAEFDRAI